MDAVTTSTAVPSPTPTTAPSPIPSATPSPTSVPDDHGDDFSTATEINVGTTIDGEIGDVDDFDYFRFETEAGKGYVVNVEGEQEVVLYDSSRLLAFDQGEGIVWLSWVEEEYYVYVARSQGRYTISVSEIDYQDLHGNHRRWATRLTLGAPVDGVIGTHWDEDYFSFEAVEGELYTIAASLGSLVDSQITVVNTEGQELAQNDNYADTRGSRLEWIAPSSGEFFVMVKSTWNFIAAGSYSLLVEVSSYEDDHGYDSATATEVALGEMIEGIIDIEVDVDYFWFQGDEEETYYVDIELDTLRAGWLVVDDFDEMEPKGIETTWTNKGRLIWTANRTGKHFFAVISDRGSWTGSYSVQVSLSNYEDDHADDVADASVATLVHPMGGYLGAVGDVDYFKFEAVKNEHYLINLDYECPIYFPADLYRPITEWVCDPTDMRLTLFASDGTELKSQDSWNFKSHISMKWIAIEDGEFYVEVSRNPEETALFLNSYVIGVDISLERDHDADEWSLAAEIAIGETIEAEIGADLDVDYFKFMAEAGKTYFVHLHLLGIDYINASVFDVNDRRSLWDAGCGPEEDKVLRIDAQESGYHHVALWGHDPFGNCWTAMGSYSIRIEESD